MAKSSNENIKYSFRQSWQRKLLALLIVDGSKFVSEGLIKPDYFEKASDVQIATTVVRLYEKYGVPLTFRTVENALQKDYKDHANLPKIIRRLHKIQRTSQAIEEIEDRQLRDQVKRFAQHQAYKTALNGAVDLIESDNLEELEKVWTKPLLVGKGVGDLDESFYFSSFSARNKRRLQRPDILGTLIPPIDDIIGGGFKRRQLITALGSTGTGKSFFLDHIAKSAVIQKKKVVFYTLEMDIDEVAGRLDAAFAGVKIRELQDRTEKIASTMREFEKKYGDLLVLKWFPAQTAGVAALRAHLLHLKLRGFVPDALLVDYINLLKRESGESFQALGDVYIGLRGLVQEFNLWGITAAQANRPSKNLSEKAMDLITLERIAESYAGAMHSDGVFTLNRNAKEKQKEQMRMFVAKYRNERDGMIIRISTDFAGGVFYKR